MPRIVCTTQTRFIHEAVAVVVNFVATLTRRTHGARARTPCTELSNTFTALRTKRAHTYPCVCTWSVKTPLRRARQTNTSFVDGPVAIVINTVVACLTGRTCGNNRHITCCTIGHSAVNRNATITDDASINTNKYITPSDLLCNIKRTIHDIQCRYNDIFS
jgi:hypothetical protein